MRRCRGAFGRRGSKWLCDRLAGSDWLRFRAKSGPSQRDKKYAVTRFLGALGPRTQEEPRIRRYRIEFDATDARVTVREAPLLGVVAQALQLLARHRARFALVERR